MLKGARGNVITLLLKKKEKKTYLIFYILTFQNLLSRRLVRGIRRGLRCLSVQASSELGIHHHVSPPVDLLSPEEQMMKDTGTKCKLTAPGPVKRCIPEDLVRRSIW